MKKREKSAVHVFRRKAALALKLLLASCRSFILLVKVEFVRRCWFLWREENWRTQRKTLKQSKERTNSKLNLHGTGTESNPSHSGEIHCKSTLTTVRSLLPLHWSMNEWMCIYIPHISHTCSVPRLIIFAMTAGKRFLQSL